MKRTSAGANNVAPEALGFLTVSSLNGRYVGGLLLLNFAGRPLEFHCTAPVAPNRPQEILFGPTLWPYLFGEQIGKALHAKASSATAYFSDNAHAATLGEWIEQPVGLVLGDADESDDPARSAHAAEQATGAANAAPEPWVECSLGGQRVAAGNAGEGDRLTAAWNSAGARFSLVEPFERIRAALQEARAA